LAEGTAGGGIESRWEALLRITRSWRLEWNAGELLGRVCREAVELLGAERGLVFVLENEELSVRGAWPGGELPAETLDAARAAADGVVNTGRAIFAHQLEGDAGEAGGAVYCVPLTSSRGILGALYARGGAARGGQKQDEELFELLGLQAASALEHLSLYQSAIRDPLTRLFSHRYFQEQVDQQIRQARRAGRPVSMLVMDLDNFKELNDTAGHKAGNQYLVAVADALRAALRDSDVIARFGGDEFEVLLPETAAAGARLVAEKLRERLDALDTPGGVEVTVSLGAASFPVNALDAETLFLRADAALYEAKGAGRDRVAVSSHEEKPAADPSAERGRGSSRPREHEALAGTPEIETGRGAPRTPDGPAFEAPAQEQVDGHPVIDRLGTGSSGEVLLVEQTELNREVALKRPHTANLTREQAAAFEREALTTAALSHPGVVPIYTMGTDADGRRYYTMKSLHDFSLGDILERRRAGDAEVLRKYTQSRLLDIVHSVSETIAYAHRSRIAHLDLNPRNILVGEFGEVVVIDWEDQHPAAARISAVRGARAVERHGPGDAQRRSQPGDHALRDPHRQVTIRACGHALDDAGPARGQARTAGGRRSRAGGGPDPLGAVHGRAAPRSARADLRRGVRRQAGPLRAQRARVGGDSLRRGRTRSEHGRLGDAAGRVAGVRRRAHRPRLRRPGDPLAQAGARRLPVHLRGLGGEPRGTVADRPRRQRRR
jgi:diguanylate cyclase (GGDEF)-like protein